MEASRAPLSADPLEQLAGRGEAEASREDHDRLETWRALAALEQADLGSVQVAGIGEGLLRQSRAFALLAQVGSELLADWLHRPTLAMRRRKIHRQSSLTATVRLTAERPDWTAANGSSVWRQPYS